MQTPHGRGPGLRAVVRVADAPRARTRQQPPPYDCRPCRAAPPLTGTGERRRSRVHAAPLLAMQRSSTPSPTRRRFTPSPICSAALRRRRPINGYLVRHPHAKADGRRFRAARPLDDFTHVDFRLGQLRAVGARLAVASQTRGRFYRHLSVEQLEKVIGNLFTQTLEEAPRRTARTADDRTVAARAPHASSAARPAVEATAPIAGAAAPIAGTVGTIAKAVRPVVGSSPSAVAARAPRAPSRLRPQDPLDGLRYLLVASHFVSFLPYPRSRA